MNLGDFLNADSDTIFFGGTDILLFDLKMQRATAVIFVFHSFGVRWKKKYLQNSHYKKSFIQSVSQSLCKMSRLI